MSFSWLPDAALDPHPRLTWLVECGFDFTVRALYHKEEILPPEYRLDPGTLVVSNHQRDADVPILTTVLCRREGMHIRWPLPFYATREDIFHPGFLRDRLIDSGWNRSLASWLGSIPLGWLLRIIRARPLRRVREFTANETLRLLIDTLPPNTDPRNLFSARGTREILGRLGSMPAKLQHLDPHCLGEAGRGFWGLRRLSCAAIGQIAAGFRAQTATQLKDFARLLDAGRIVFLAPEGTTSEDGRLRRIRAGAWRICQIATRPPPILSLALGYDALSPGRLRIVVKIGAVKNPPYPDTRAAFDSLLKTTILKLHPITPSHLIGRFLRAGPRRFTTAEFCTWLERATRVIRTTELTLDPLLNRTPPAKLAGSRLAWLARRSLIELDGSVWINRRPVGTPPGWHTPAETVAYMDNVLTDITGLVPGLAGALSP